VARQLAAKGANVIIVSRDVEKMKAALDEAKVRLTTQLDSL
jgi:short-subunit dehydrogenase